jgi:DNA modification methylase
MKLILGNSLEELKKLEDNSVDSIVTDPPYELGFMGKKWDNTGIAYNVDLWAECLRVLKPGGHLLAFSGTRTYHRMAVAIEDAGFEVRDMIEWVYGSGFPKSLSVGKAVDKLQGNERSSEVVKGKIFTGSNNNINGEAGEYEITKGTSPYEGWGTALKPSHEPICMARKPLAEKTVAQNVLKYGTGGINIDESRVKANKDDKFGGGGLNSPKNGFMGNTDNTYKKGTGFRDDTLQGRFPANLIHDNSDEVIECFPETKTNAGGISTMGGMFGNGAKTKTICSLGDSGSASRFFKSIIYNPKASKAERNKGCEGLDIKQNLQGLDNRGRTLEREDGSKTLVDRFSKTPATNNHPTVKPIALMEYLIKMVTPKGGIVLDPFMGSGSTGVAAKKNGYDFIGIDMTQEYIEIAKARIEATEIENKLL